MIVVAGVWTSICFGILVATDVAEDCLVYDVGGEGSSSRTPVIPLHDSVIIGVFKGHQNLQSSSYVNSTDGSDEGHDDVKFEVHFEASGKKFLLRFKGHKLFLLQEAIPSVDMGVANFPLYEVRGKWLYVGVAAGGGWLTVTNPAQAESVFQTPLGVDTSDCQLSVASSYRLALTYNCIAGCPTVRSGGSVVTAGLPLERSLSLYLQADDVRYTVLLTVKLSLEGLVKESLLLEVRPGLLRLHEWNRVDLTLERRRDEVEAWLEVNGEAGASDVATGRLVSAALDLEELTHGALSTYCRPTRPSGQASSETTLTSRLCSWNLVWSLAGTSSLLLVLLLGTCCCLCRIKSGKADSSIPPPGVTMNSLRHPRTGDKTLSYHYYEEVEAMMDDVRRPTKLQEDTVRPLGEMQRPAMPRENLPEEHLDLGTGEGLLTSGFYQNLSLNTRT